MSVLEHDWRAAMRPKNRDGKRTENGLQAHLRIVHGYALTSLAGLTVVQLVLRHERDHPVQRGHGQ